MQTFSEVPAILSSIPWKLLSTFITEGTISFLCHPEAVGVYDAGTVHGEVGTILIGEGIEIRKNGVVTEALLCKAINENPFHDVVLSAEQAKAIAKSTRLSPPTLQRQILDQIGRDLLDLSARPKLDAFFREYFGTANSILDFIEIELSGARVSSSIPPKRLVGHPTEVRKNAITAVLMMSEAYLQYALSASEHSNSIYTDDVIFRLMAAASPPNISPTAQSATQSSINVVLDAIELPDVGWMVNRSVLSLDDVLEFRRSKEGKQFRVFIEDFAKNAGGAKSSELKEKLHKRIISSFHVKTGWEKGWDSKTSKAVRLLVSTGLGLIPGPGTVLSAATSIADGVVDSAVIPRNYRPTLVLENKIKNHVDQQKIEDERKTTIVLPSLSKLRRQGYEATMVFRQEETGRIVILQVPGKEMKWSLRIDLKFPECQKYLDEFEKMLPAPGSKERELVDALGDGYDMTQLNTHFSNVEGAGTLSQEFVLRKGSEEKRVVGDTPDFWKFVMDRSCLKDPNAYSAFVKKLEE